MQNMSKGHTTVSAVKAGGVCLGLIAVLMLASASISLGGTFVAFGPEDFARETSEPFMETRSFTVLNPNTDYTLRIDNGGLGGEFDEVPVEEVSSAVIMLNGIEVAGPSDFSKAIKVIEKPVALSTDNVLTVELRSQPGSGITLQIIGIDNDPPTITATVDPPANAA